MDRQEGLWYVEECRLATDRFGSRRAGTYVATHGGFADEGSARAFVYVAERNDDGQRVYVVYQSSAPPGLAELLRVPRR